MKKTAFSIILGILAAFIAVRQASAAAFNILVALLALCGLYSAFEHDGISAFRYYTEDSNIFLAVISVISAIAEILNIHTGIVFEYLKFSSITCITLTFITVIFVLAPKRGYVKMLFKGSSLYLHLLCPILSLTAYLLFEKACTPHPCFIPLSVIPTVIYGLTVTPLAAKAIVKPPYFFLDVRKQGLPKTILWLLIITLMNLLISTAIFFLKHGSSF